MTESHCVELTRYRGTWAWINLHYIKEANSHSVTWVRRHFLQKENQWASNTKLIISERWRCWEVIAEASIRTFEDRALGTKILENYAGKMCLHTTTRWRYLLKLFRSERPASSSRSNTDLFSKSSPIYVLQIRQMREISIISCAAAELQIIMLLKAARLTQLLTMKWRASTDLFQSECNLKPLQI